MELEQVHSGPDGVPSSKASETVLLVEDEEGVRELVRDILQEKGYALLAARDAEEAIQTSGRHCGPIHLLLTDVVMPRISGRMLAERLAPLRPEMRVLYVSGYTENAIVHHGVLDHGTAFLQKPFSAETLAQEVWEVLGAVPPKREPTRGPDQGFQIQITHSLTWTVKAWARS